MAKNNTALFVLLGAGLVLMIVVSSCQASKMDDNVEISGKSASSTSSSSLARFKRGYGGGGGGGHGGGGGGGHGGYGSGPGAGGGARGPVYFCGWVGSKMGTSYGYGK